MLSLEKLWNKLEIRVLVISSLSLQILLLVLASFQKHVISYRWAQTTNKTWQGPLALMFHWLLWLAYNMADYVATVALAYLLVSEIFKATPQSKNHYLHMFWAPFFILHIGGQDIITALSVEDNELWSRHLLTMLSQLGLAICIYLSSNLQVGELRVPAALMFSVAIFKYVERIWSLQRASQAALRNSMITKPDPGLNYANLVQVYTSYRASGLTAEIELEVEKQTDDLEIPQAYQSAQIEDSKYKEIVCMAYEFFQTFKRVFVDLILSYEDREGSQKYFETLKTDDAYKLIEIELSWMYEILHSRGSVIYSFKHYGWISRVVTLFVTTVTLCLFAMSDHTGYGRFETSLTYVLLGGAVGLEIIALVFMLLSFWTYVEMRNSRFFSRFFVGHANFLFHIQEKWVRPKKKPRWSNKMAQYSLITYSLVDQPCRSRSIMKCLGLKDTWDHYRYTTCVTVNEYLKELVFQVLKKKMIEIDDPTNYRRFTNHRGQWALQRKGYYHEFAWSVEAEFDDSILLWHIATDLLFNDPGKPQPKPESKPEMTSAREISQHISDYMSFLLIMRPFMMPAGIGQIRFGDTCAEVNSFLQPQSAIDKGTAVKRILDVNTDFDPGLVKGERSKSVLFKGCMLAHNLKKQLITDENLAQDWNKMWRLISVVWVEMLCYAASKCSGQYHAKQLSKGGELLTVIWFLMAHLGMGDQYQIEQGDGRYKMTVTK
ncbi:hypothetical protein FCM35_KLT10399 [Carex littledalei]|uniref:DUF4220 domain-containing protein n=1 Tax=Carex littledalei TaxID=544730 RepID=A0A833QUB2_9POAL|nr:hypothetical protein FCM35_KLT10399 [Carex littledalei]